MDVLPAELADRVAGATPGDEEEGDEVTPSEGPWVLVATASGLGKRVPVDQFRLQKRAGMGLRGIRFRRDGDSLVGLRVMGADGRTLYRTSLLRPAGAARLSLPRFGTQAWVRIEAAQASQVLALPRRRPR